MPLTALVIGGGIAGLSAAAAALKHFDKVLLVDKDLLISDTNEELAEVKKRRSGVSQYLEPHTLLGGGLDALDRLLPGFKRSLYNAGGSSYDCGEKLMIYDHGGRFVRGKTSVEMTIGSRRLINETLYRHLSVFAGSKLSILNKAKVVGLMWDTTKTRVQGVKLSTGQEILTNLVIVADGRRSQLPHWLKTEAGIALPPPKKVDGKTLYAARWMLLPEDYDMDKEWTSIVIMGRPHLSKGGLALPAEGRLIQVSLVGMMGQRPPIDEKGYMAYAKSLPDPALYELMQRCTPVSKISFYAGTANIQQRYDVAKMPRGLIVLGDAYQALNPIFGQGMTVGAISGEFLGDYLKQEFKLAQGNEAEKLKVLQGRKFASRFQKALAKKIAIAWDLAVSDDLRYPTTEVSGVKPLPKFMLKFMDATFVVAQKDLKIWTTFVEVAHMKKNPSAIFSPRILAKALGVMIKGKPKNNEMPQATPTPTPLSNSSSLSTDRSTASGVIASLTASSLSLHESVGVFKGVALAVEPKGHTALTA